MKNIVQKLLLGFLFCVMPLMIKASAPTPTPAPNTSVSNEVSMIKGEGAIEKWFLEGFAKAKVQMSSYVGPLSRLGRAIGCIGALIYLGFLGLQMQEGARPWQVTPMIRPVLILFFLSNWSGFARLIDVPFDKLSEFSLTSFEEVEKKADANRILLYQKQKEAYDLAFKLEARALGQKAKNSEIDSQKSEGFSWSGLFDVLNPKPILDAGETMIDSMKLILEHQVLKMSAKIQIFASNLIEAIALILLRVCVYGIYAFQKVWEMVLYGLGPIAVGFSLIPGFEGTLQNWVSKYINIKLFGFIAGFSLVIGNVLMTAGYEMALKRYDFILSNPDPKIVQANMTLFTEGYGFIYAIVIVAVSYIITGILVLMTPTIADSIISAGGSQMFSSAKQSAGSMIRGGKGMLSGGRHSTQALSQGIDKFSKFFK